MSGRLDLVWVVLGLAAVVLGIWLGVTGADVSPIFTEAPPVVGAGGRGR
jgi:hypothetical protein